MASPVLLQGFPADSMITKSSSWLCAPKLPDPPLNEAGLSMLVRSVPTLSALTLRDLLADEDEECAAPLCEEDEDEEEDVCAYLSSLDNIEGVPCGFIM